MMHFRKIEINDLKIVAPLKCGTRWLLDRAEKSSFVYIDNLKEETDSKTIFLYREPNNHLISALHTDYIINECDLNKTLDNLLNYKSAHWRGDMYENIHRAWTYNKFKMVNYLDISELINDYDFDKNKYDFSVQSPYFITKQMVLDLIPVDIKEELFKMADNNNFWLKQIQENNDKVLSKNVIDRLDNIELQYQKNDKIKIVGYESMIDNYQSMISNYQSIISNFPSRISFYETKSNEDKLTINLKNDIIKKNNLLIIEQNDLIYQNRSIIENYIRLNRKKSLI